ncbi:MAG: sulfotransferase [Caldilineaceae bacterium]
MSLKIIGAGFGRTGTKSLQVALEQLGFAPCYHMTAVFTHPDHVATWAAATAGQPVDWQHFLQGYQATVDWPGCTFYQELMAAYPDAKVLLNVRDPERWYQSAYDTIYGATRDLPTFVRWLRPSIGRSVDMINQLIWRQTFGDAFADKARAIAIFNAHNEEVQRVVPPERLLVYEVKEGWEPLCRFLNVPVPETPFPHLNDTAEFQKMANRRRLLGRLVPWLLAVLVVVVALVVYWLLRG